MNYNVSRKNYESEALYNDLEKPSLYEKQSIGELWFDKLAKQANSMKDLIINNCNLKIHKYLIMNGGSEP